MNTENNPESIRLVRFLALCGVASRRKAADVVADGRVAVNGETVSDPGHPVHPGDEVCCDGKVLHPPENYRYVMLHKPAGYLCSMADPHAERFAIDLIPGGRADRLVSAGRLDRDSEGLIVFSNDGQFIQELAHPSFAVHKVYDVWTMPVLERKDAAAMLRGIPDDGERLCALAVTLPEQPGEPASVTLGTGRKREVRRLCTACGKDVLRLLRRRIGGLELDIPPGQTRELSSDDLARLRQNR